MRNSNPIEYQGTEYPAAYIEMDGNIGCIRIATESLLKVLNTDGLESEDVPEEVNAVDNQIAYYVSDEEFLLPIKEVRKIVRVAYNELEPICPSAQKTIRELKKGEFFRLKDSDTAPVWVRDEYIPSLKKYSTYKFDDINHEHPLKGSIKVFIGFTF
ncbi:hypothetical protein POZ03_01270 [Bacteroides uniformis]|uniref:hypothetical protein n=1 Tax=Bacteroides uniformis TaxID=820 RepID=UPI00233EA9EF|nr:hypothetical protein [Bacteroides uniformis]MDC1809088.1 hypothetical protein [Bacteroides uniformis]